MSTPEEQISAWCRALDVPSERQLALLLGYSPQNLTKWKGRGHVPEAAQRRFQTLLRAHEHDQRRRKVREKLGHQVMYEGLCLALFIAPAFEASGTRVSVLDYGAYLRDFASFFEEIHLACAERIEAHRQAHGCTAPEALEALVRQIGKPDAIGDFCARIMDRAAEWRYDPPPEPPPEPPDGQ